MNLIPNDPARTRLILTKGIDDQIAALAASQCGVFSITQARELGATKAIAQSRVRNGRWLQVFLGTYRLSGVPETRRQLMWAATLWGAPDALISHRSAAWLWGIFDEEPWIIDLSTHREHSLRTHVFRAHRLGAWSRSDAKKVDGIPTTSPERTLIDLAAVLPQARLSAAVEAAVHLQLTSRKRLRERSEEMASSGRTGTVKLRAVLQSRKDTDVPDASTLETMLREVIADHGLPSPVSQHKIIIGGRELGRVDLAFPDRKVAIEADSWKHHGDRKAFEHDRVRQNDIVVHDWKMFRFTFIEVRDHPARVAATIAQALRAPAA